ncbi:MAG: hypothetical protein IH857_00455 [Deltaproteobacteria bacterium]|nr:hypothetical protein [Deltaproteobacteria bacterium]
MKRGEVWWVHFDPSVGGEIRKQRSTVKKELRALASYRMNRSSLEANHDPN